MGVRFLNTKRIESNYHEQKSNPRKNFYAIGLDDKGRSYITKMEGYLRMEAEKESIWWVKHHNLKLEGVYVFQNQIG